MSQYKSTQLLPWMRQVRRAIHSEPELSFEEVKTARRIGDELEAMGLKYRYEGPGSAVTARIAGTSSNTQAIALRAEMDALPGRETTGLSFAPANGNAMHACGHDAHIAMLLGAARLLTAEPPKDPVVLLFQPAEERGSGSRRVIADGGLENVRSIFAGHVTHQYLTGQIMVAPGVMTAQSDRFRIRIRGRGGHGARPHEATDAIVIAGFLITAIQTLVSREINPLHPSVVTIGRIEAGSAPNVIAEDAVLEGTIRTTLEEVREQLQTGLRRMIEATAALHDARVELEIQTGNPPVVNSPREAAIARRAACHVVGEPAVPATEYPSMGSEDFSYYLDVCPGCYVRFGARAPDWEPIPLHSPAFDIDEDVLMVGADFFDAVAREATGDDSWRRI
jgi:hippurate hydrolase